MNTLLIGYFSKTHGIKGELIIHLNATVNVQTIKAFFTESQAGMEPHFAEHISFLKQSLLVKIEDVTSIELARKFIGKKVHVNADAVVPENDNEFIGYVIFENTIGALGSITHINDTGTQILATLIYKEKEITLPLHPELITEIDDKKKVIFYNSPNGLIDLLLN
ncbi:MAG: hypothetical protein JSU07_05255 [Bacteroidetes bacterium]|nr:hypothetical protein [Bacteroidota bacterium]